MVLGDLGMKNDKSTRLGEQKNIFTHILNLLI